MYVRISRKAFDSAEFIIVFYIELCMYVREPQKYFLPF